MKYFKLLIGFMLICLSLSMTGQTTETARTSGQYGYQFTDTAYIDTTGTDTGDSLVYNIQATKFIKYEVPTVIITRRTGSYTKANVKVYKSPDFVTWTLVETLTYAGTDVSTTTTGAIDTIYQPYLKYMINPIDSAQSLSVKILTTIEKEE